LLGFAALAESALAEIAQLGGGGSPPSPPIDGGIASIVSPAAAASLVVKVSPGSVVSAYAINLTTIDGFLVLVDATAVPFDGPIAPLAAVPLPAGSMVTIDAARAPLVFSVGIVAALTSAVSPYMVITSDGLTGLISCQAQ
jgi:hypothetical protein